MRKLHGSEFYISDDGVASIRVLPEGKERSLGRVGIDDIEPDTLPTERHAAQRWKETSDFLRSERIRSKVSLVLERAANLSYGFLWISFSFDRNLARKRWGSRIGIEELDEAMVTLADKLEALWPDYHGRIEREPTPEFKGWYFSMEIMDEDPAEKFFKVFLGMLKRNPSLREYLEPA